MIKEYFILILFFCSSLFCQIDNGFYLYSPVISYPAENEVFKTFLMDTSGVIMNQWTHENSTSSTPYLLSDSTLLRPSKINPPSFDAGGTGGELQLLSWDNEILWEYRFMNNSHSQHHDIEPLDNGNILVLLWERRSQEEALLAGKESHTGDIWSEKIIEIEPVFPDSINIVWEWYLWDHLVQDLNPNLDNFGVISNNPGKLDINYALTSNEGPQPPQFTNADFIHLNAIDYNENLKLITFSSRKTNEVYIINHNISTIESSTDMGDFIYRWGNPRIYNRGTYLNQILYAPHSVNWTSDFSLIIFNNGVNRPEGNYSSIELIDLPILDNGEYYIDNSQPFEPILSTTNFNLNGNFYTANQGGAYLLENHNILITISTMKRILEIDQVGEIKFDFYYDGNGSIPRAQKYVSTYLNNSILIGDLNSDNLIDILDIIILVNIILNTEYNSSADINNDSYINIQDIIIIVNIIIS